MPSLPPKMKVLSTLAKDCSKMDAYKMMLYDLSIW